MRLNIERTAKPSQQQQQQRPRKEKKKTGIERVELEKILSPR
jgi:hypothetical protein